MGLKLRIEYSDRNEILTRINIYQEGYGGTADVRYAHSGIRVEWGDQSGDGLPLIYGSSCTIYFDALFDYEFLYLFSADARKHRVEIEKDNVLFWAGFIEPDSWSEPLIATPYPIQCTAYDGLGFLKDTPFLDEVSEPYDGYKTMFEIIEICLNKTGLALTINTAIDWHEELQAGGTDLLKVHLIDCDNFRDLSCYEVIESLLRECRILQRAGQWWIISNSNFARNPISYFATTAAGSVSTGSFDPTAAGWWFNGQATMEILPAFKRLVYVQNFGYTGNVIDNGSFDVYQLNDFEGWENLNTLPVQRDLIKDESKCVYIPGKQYPAGGYGALTDGIKTSFPIKQTAVVGNFELRYIPVSQFGNASADIFIEIRLVAGATTYYLRRVPYVATRESAAFEWIVWSGASPAYDQKIPLSTHLKWESGSGHRGEYYNYYDLVTGWGLNEIEDHFSTFEAKIPGIPADGTMEIYLYVPYANTKPLLAPEIRGVCYTGLKFDLFTIDEEKENPIQQSFKITNTAINNFVPDTVEMIVGDYPELDNAALMYTGGISRADETHTTGWALQGSTDYNTFVRFIALLTASAMRTPRQNYAARLADAIPRLNFIIEDHDNGDKRLVENGISYDDRMQIIEGKYTEVTAVNFTGLTVEVATEFDDKTGLSTAINDPDAPNRGGRSTPANPVNTEKSAIIINNLGMTNSPDSYFDGDYFEYIQNPDTGFSAIIPIIGIEILQDDHAFEIGDAIRHNGTVWVKAIADTLINSRAVGIVNNVIDGDVFRYLPGGLLASPDYTPGARYFLSPDTAGALFIQSEPEAWPDGSFIQFIGTGTPEGLIIEIDAKDDSDGATGITGSDTFVVHINFEAIEAENYICPYAMKFTAMKHSQTNAPTLSVALDTDMAEYDTLTITPDAVGLVTLTGIWL